VPSTRPPRVAVDRQLLPAAVQQPREAVQITLPGGDNPPRQRFHPLHVGRSRVVHLLAHFPKISVESEVLHPWQALEGVCDGLALAIPHHRRHRDAVGGGHPVDVPPLTDRLVGKLATTAPGPDRDDDVAAGVAIELARLHVGAEGGIVGNKPPVHQAVPAARRRGDLRRSKVRWGRRRRTGDVPEEEVLVLRRRRLEASLSRHRLSGVVLEEEWAPVIGVVRRHENVGEGLAEADIAEKLGHHRLEGVVVVLLAKSLAHRENRRKAAHREDRRRPPAVHLGDPLGSEGRGARQTEGQERSRRGPGEDVENGVSRDG
jgi:hypothetical protein